MRISTTGMNSCGVISLGFFSHIAVNKEWSGPSIVEKPFYDWYCEKVYNLFQPDSSFTVSCFEEAMQLITNHSDDPVAQGEWDEDEDDYPRFCPSTKTVMATLTETQLLVSERYWQKCLKKWGFKKIRTFGNVNGETNVLYMRIPLNMRNYKI